MQKEDTSWLDGAAYEHYVGRWSRLVGEMFVDWLALPAGLSWVDVGCGTGALTEMLLTRAYPSRVVGVELSEGYLSAARGKVADTRAEFRQGDAQALPLDPGEADAAVSGLVLNFVPDKQRALEEMRRIVKPGSTVAVYVWDYGGEMQLMRYFWKAATDLFADGAENDEGNRFPICKKEALEHLFRSAKLETVETHAMDAPTVFADFDDYWSPFLGGQGPAGAYCAALPADERERLRLRLENMLPFNSDGSISLVARAWAVRGTV